MRSELIEATKCESNELKQSLSLGTYVYKTAFSSIITYNTEVRQLIPLTEIYQFRLLELEAKGRSAPRCAINLQESPPFLAGIMIYKPTKYYVT